MAKGVIEVAETNPFDFQMLHETACSIEGSRVLSEARKRAASILQLARKKKFSIFQSVEEKGFLIGFQRGAKDGLKTFSRQSSEVRNFRRHLEQHCLEHLAKILPAVIEQNPSAIKIVTKQALAQLKPRIKRLPLLYVVCHKELVSTVKEFFNSICISVQIQHDQEADRTIHTKIRFITATGCLEITTSELMHGLLEQSLRRLSPLLLEESDVHEYNHC